MNILGWSKSLFGFFHTILQKKKKPDKPFGQPSIILKQQQKMLAVLENFLINQYNIQIWDFL